MMLVECFYIIQKWGVHVDWAYVYNKILMSSSIIIELLDGIGTQLLVIIDYMHIVVAISYSNCHILVIVIVVLVEFNVRVGISKMYI